MEDQKLNEKESLELITRMILQTRNRLQPSDGSLLLSWGLLTVGVATVTMVLMLITRQPECQALWALMALGTFFNRKAKKNGHKPAARTYVDTISDNIGKFAANLFWPTTLICLLFEFVILPQVGYDNANSPWMLLFVFALLGMGFAMSMLGIVLKQKVLVVGGAIGVTGGLFTACAAICQVPVTVWWGYPLFIVCFTCMMVIPGVVMRNQARKENNERA